MRGVRIEHGCIQLSNGELGVVLGAQTRVNLHRDSRRDLVAGRARPAASETRRMHVVIRAPEAVEACKGLCRV